MIGLDIVMLSGIPLLLLVAVVQVRRSASFWHTLGTLVLTSYAVILVAVTFFPLPVDGRYIADMRADGWALDYNLVPFETIGKVFASAPMSTLVQVVGNLLMLIPLAVLLPSLWPRWRTWRLVVPVIVGGSCAIELIQLGASDAYGFTYKRFDVDDLILNVAGATVAYGLFSLVVRLRRGARVSSGSLARPE